MARMFALCWAVAVCYGQLTSKGMLLCLEKLRGLAMVSCAAWGHAITAGP